MIKSYRDAGVDIDAGDGFAAYIGSIESAAIRRNGVLPRGGFASAFPVDTSEYADPVIFSSTDGVGTKLLVAKALDDFETIGIDLVAMCVNDLIVHGAKPVQFLDYIACDRINRRILDPIIRGIVTGCEIANCELAGGETAELPGLYERDTFDLAGFAIGIGERKRVLPRFDRDLDGASIYGLPSSGVHSNGLSLARSLMPDTDVEMYRELLTPTRIYVDEIVGFADAGVISGAAHITGGGLSGNIARLLPKGMNAHLTYDWPRPPIFDRIRALGCIEDEEMRRVFNLGIGMAVIVDTSLRNEFESVVDDSKVPIYRIGEVVCG